LELKAANKGMESSGGTRASRIYKEVGYYNSYSITKEVQCGIGHLELCPDYRRSKFGFPESPGEVTLRSHILNNGARNQDAPLCTHYAYHDDFRHHLVWDYILTYPIKYRDLSKDATVVITAWTGYNELIGGCNFRFFDAMGRLRQGKQKIRFLDKDQWRAYMAETERRQSTGLPSIDLLANETSDVLYDSEKRLERLRIQQARGALQEGNKVRVGGEELDWLDKLSLSRLQSIITDAHVQKRTPGNALTPTEYYLVLEMPTFPHSIIFEEKLCGTITPHKPYTDVDEFSPMYTSSMLRKTIAFDPLDRNIPGACFNIIADWEMNEDSPSEEQYLKLAKHAMRGTLDPNIEPNLQEKKAIDKIVRVPTVPGKHMSLEDKRLLQKFRHCLKENKRALPKFLLSVDWNNEEDVNEISEILKSWRSEVVLETSDALKLLGKGVAFQSPIVRNYAIDTLKMRSDEEMVVYLLQLVQALRYEPEHVNDEGDVVSPLALYLIERSCAAPTLANYFYWYLKVEKGEPVNEVSGDPLVDLEESEAYYFGKLQPKVPAQIKIGARDDIYFYYVFQRIFNKFCAELALDTGAGADTIARLQAADKYMTQIAACQTLSREERGRKDAKEARLRLELAKAGLDKIPDGFEYIPNPLYPEVGITGMSPEKTKVFSSAIYPAVITFSSTTSGEMEYMRESEAGLEERAGERVGSDASEQQQQQQQGGEEEEQSQQKKVQSLRVFFKSGDDLRQDQMIMQMMELMNRLLKEVGIEGHLITYGILATGKRDGIMEFVDNSQPVSGVLKNYGNSILNFLREASPDPTIANGVDKQVMEVFVKSTAASCVVTYILGIGDRHLDNIMMKPTGHLFHIDFGFIFGRDPKPLPPKFRFTKEMADAMGGTDGEHFLEFCKFACEAYNHLRKSADLIINLLVLMMDAGIPDLSGEHASPEVALQRVEENFRLDLDDEEAAVHFTNLINQSMFAMAPRVMEVLHQVAVARR